MRKRLSACVYGRVQGIGFRFFVLRVASHLGLSGVVRNADAGTVEVVAEGELRDLETLLEHLREGPARARVDGVESSWGEETGEYEGFTVSA